MGVFNRLFKMGQSEAHSLVDKLEDPIKLTEQGIRDLKKNLDESLQAFAEVKALAIRSKREINEYTNQSKNYEQKAMLILKKTQSGGIDAAEADRLAGEALARKADADANAVRTQGDLVKLEANVKQLDTNIKALKSKITHYENELKTLKARAKVSEATKKINKSMSGIDSGSTIAMLEKMKDKVARDEELAEAYGEMADSNKSIDEELDAAINDPEVKASDALEEMKQKMNMNE
ncbi:MAG: PspA/IM30 family protein [Salinivirgaceae bacterium]|jgi:phage shock protein A|nr:PspA/IM30 family protein [Salinivirgaceae bacterium]